MSSLKDFFDKHDFGLLLLRLLLGALLSYHGATFLLQGSSMFRGMGQAASVLGLSAGYLYLGFFVCILYTVAGVFLILGFVFRWTCFVLLLTFAPLLYQYWNTGKLLEPITPHALTVAVVAFSFLFIGPGKFSVDK
ncbi:MAG: hypothetical protein A2Y14_00270 [Verrucomicrobia bacterium GWF2_51_19]|nr:MAG: hypothetical protein A2Y14_00270 [Verrucomicrobia bacterium GWF2_51_19]HCJ11923.1 hypothetical protein [Opitutae bacterium]